MFEGRSLVKDLVGRDKTAEMPVEEQEDDLAKHFIVSAVASAAFRRGCTREEFKSRNIRDAAKLPPATPEAPCRVCTCKRERHNHRRANGDNVATLCVRVYSLCVCGGESGGQCRNAGM
jgi:hypothetical protein